MSNFNCSKQLSHPLKSSNFVHSPLTANAVRNGNEQVGEILKSCHSFSELKKQKGVNNPVDAINFFLASILAKTENSAA